MKYVTPFTHPPTLCTTLKIKMSHYTPSPTPGHTKNISVSDSVQIKGGGHLKNNATKTHIGVVWI